MKLKVGMHDTATNCESTRASVAARSAQPATSTLDPRPAPLPFDGLAQPAILAKPSTALSRAPSPSLYPTSPPSWRVALGRALSLSRTLSLPSLTDRPRLSVPSSSPRICSLYRGRAHLARFAQITTACTPRPSSHAPCLCFK